MTDDRRRIIALANDRMLDGDEVAVREGRGVLITPRKRLAAEIAWLPGLEPEEIRQYLATTGYATAVLRTQGLPTLARANLLADRMVRADLSVVPPLKVAECIVELASVHERIRADEVTTVINEARLSAAIPMASRQDVMEELRGRRSYYRDAMEHCLDDLDMSSMVKVVTSMVNLATRDGTQHAPALIDNLVDSYYERKIREKMDASREGIATLVSQVRDQFGSSTLVRVPRLVEHIERALKSWDVLAQPLQVSLASRGMGHKASDEIMHEVRNLAVEMFNRQGPEMLDVARSLTRTLREVFAEMEPIKERLDEDVSTLDGIAAQRTRALAKQEAERALMLAKLSSHQKTMQQQNRNGWGCWLAIATLLVVAFGIVQMMQDFDRGGNRPPTPSSTSTEPSYVRPSVARDDVLSTAEIRWCLRQDIRVETWRELARSANDVDEFNRRVNDFNARCTSYRYRDYDMRQAREDVTRERLAIVARARASW